MLWLNPSCENRRIARQWSGMIASRPARRLIRRFDMTEREQRSPSQTAGEAVRRGFLRRCPMCGRGRVFTGLLRMNASCGECEYNFRREPGYFLGSTYVNYGFTAGLTTISFVILRFGLELPRMWILPGLLLFCAVFPVFFFSFARSLWLNLDCYLDPVGASVGVKSRVADENSEKSDAAG